MSGGEHASEERAIAELRHDLRTPLNHIIGYGEMLMEDAEDRGDAAFGGAMQRVVDTAKELVAVIQNTLSPHKHHVTEEDLAALREDLRGPADGIARDAAALLESCGEGAKKDLETIRAASARLMELAARMMERPQQPPPPEGKQPQEKLAGELDQESQRVLVVDDNESNRDMLSRRLERQGYRVVQASGGEQALEIAREGGIELMLLDIMMPGMDGYQVLAAMKSGEALAAIPVIMISALDEIQSVVRCIEMGAEDYLPKPFDPVLLKARVGACIEKKRLRDLERKKTADLEEALRTLKMAQDQLIVQERLASLGAVSAGIAHEIKNPLNFVTNFAEVALSLTGELREEVGELTEDVREILANLDQSVGKIQEHGKRADSIVKAMLLHSRGQAGDQQKTDINALLSSDVNLAYHGLRAQHPDFNCTIRNDLDAAIGEITAVPQQLSRVFLNIVTNACHSVHEKSKGLGREYQPEISLRTRNAGSYVEIRIRDNGKGISQENLDKIFNPFFTTKPAGVGTGLGLSITQDIVVHAHRGELRVESVEGEYAEFIIKLPKESAPGSPAAREV
ncbi:MAG: response regulator [Candidatus Solibacter usitatus]|nr:response regulator [Candidatus Solibacter usitatus]